MSVTISQSIDNLKERYAALYDANQTAICKPVSEVVNGHRVKALAAFMRLGIPGKKMEDYRYSDFQPHFEAPLSVDFSNTTGNVNPEELFQCAVPDMDVCTIFLINGWFAGVQSVPENVVAGSFATMSQQYPELYGRYYGQQAPVERDGLVAMNTLFAQDGFFLHIKKGEVVEKPIQVINIMTGDADRIAFFRNLIIAEPNSQAKVLFCDHTLSPSRFLVNGVTEVFADENAIFDYYSVQSQHNLTTQVSGVYVNQKQYSNVLTNHLTLQCGVARNNIFVTLDGEYCESHLYGLYLADKNQHIDNFSFVDHAKPNCQSNELFKGVLDDQASGSFTGSIMVRPHAQKTNAYQSNKNLLLTKDAKFNTKPQLEIYADDVKCSHGATVGQIDEDSLFYLRARGIGEQEARILLMYAFAYEVIEKIRVEPLQEQIQSLVERRFRGELSKCEACVMCAQTPATTQLL